MGNTIPLMCLFVLESWAAQGKPLTGCARRMVLYCLGSCRWMLEAVEQRPSQFLFALLDISEKGQQSWSKHGIWQV